MDKPEALRLADELGIPHQCDFHIVCEKAADELRRLHAENASLAAALASSCDEQRHELWESGGIAGCERARVAERQRDALLEALKMIAGETPCFDNLMGDKDIARAAIKAVEETK